jgi:predicted RNA methylase
MATLSEARTTSGIGEFEFQLRLKQLHELLYRRGGVRPIHVALEELAKLMLLRIAADRMPDLEIGRGHRLGGLLTPDALARPDGSDQLKHAFTIVAAHPEFAARLPDGRMQGVWPSDEPLRIGNAEILAEAFEILQEASTTTGPLDALGAAFDVFLRGKYSHAGGLGTYLTPETVATNLTAMVLGEVELFDEGHARTTPIVGDPCCGTGRFLVAAQQHMVQSANRFESERFRRHGLFGADQSASSVAMARVNLLLYGVKQPFVFRVDDSLVDPNVDTLRGQLRAVLTNPPFGDGKYDDQDGIARTSTILGISSRRAIDPALGFVARCLELLADGGLAGIILPDGLVDGAVIRRFLSQTESIRPHEISVEANVSLPKVTFAPGGTVAKTSAVIFRRHRKRTGRLFIARADHVGYIKQGVITTADPAGDDLPAISAAFRSSVRTGTRGRYSVLSEKPLAVTVDRRRATSLDPSRYDPGALRAREELLESGGQPLRSLLVNVKRSTSAWREGVPFISVLHVNETGSVTWAKADAHSPTTPGKAVRPRDLLVSLLNPSTLRATVIPSDIEAICSAEFGIFECDDDPYVVLKLLHDPRVRAQLQPLGRGTSSSRRRITEDDLLDVIAPVPTDAIRARAGDLRGALSRLRAAEAAISQAYDL